MAKIAQTRDRLALVEQENEDLRERLEAAWEVVDQYRAFVDALPAKYRAGAPPAPEPAAAEPVTEDLPAEPVELGPSDGKSSGPDADPAPAGF